MRSTPGRLIRRKGHDSPYSHLGMRLSRLAGILAALSSVELVSAQETPRFDDSGQSAQSLLAQADPPTTDAKEASETREAMTIRIYPQILTWSRLDDDDPQMHELIKRLHEADAGCCAWTDQGMMIEEDRWPTARRIALDLGVGVTPPETAFGNGSPLPETVRNDFLAGDWAIVFDKASTAIRSPDSQAEYDDLLRAVGYDRADREHDQRGVVGAEEYFFPSREEWMRIQKRRAVVEERGQLARAIEESHRRLLDDARGLSLPTGEEWQHIRQQLSRSEQIKYLSERIQLARGTLNLNDVIVPTSIQEIANARRWRRTADVPTVPPQNEIDPFEALWRLRLTEGDINLLYPYFHHNWTLRPKDKVSKSRVRMFPTTRYCLCVLINDIPEGSGWIREYQLTDEEWGDVEKINWRVANRKTQDWK